MLNSGPAGPPGLPGPQGPRGFPGPAGRRGKGSGMMDKRDLVLMNDEGQTQVEEEDDDEEEEVLDSYKMVCQTFPVFYSNNL